MEFRLWIGIWCVIFIVLLVAFNLSFLVKYITRFTEDCFATLVAIIFIIDAIRSTLSLRKLDAESSLIAPITGDKSSSSNMTTVILFQNTTRSSTTLDPNSIEYQLIKANTEANFFFSCLLFVFTFSICMGLKSFRNKPYLPSRVN